MPFQYFPNYSKLKKNDVDEDYSLIELWNI